MISLKKHMEAHAEELARTAVGAYKSTVSTMAKAGSQAMPNMGQNLAKNLNALQEGLSESVNPEEMTAAQAGIDAELMQWSESVAQHFAEQAKEVREMMVAVAATAEALGERDARYSGQFNGLTTRLSTIAKMDDLSTMRRSVMESATELKTAVKKMAEEGEQSISALRNEVANYRAMLEQSEKREAIDPLTNLANRREIEAQIEDRMAWHRQFCVAILDLNGFKKINDVHGHVAGDDLLRQFAIELKAQFRPTDVVGRWGGDEFVLLVDSDIEEAHQRLARVRQWVFGEYKLNTGKGVIEVNMAGSIGIAVWDGTETITELIARADERMYGEKKLKSLPRSA
jgi:diguanylate cyclase (GGDEF)-like protein